MTTEYKAWENIPPHIKALSWAQCPRDNPFRQQMIRHFLAQHLATRQNKDPTNWSTIHNFHPQAYTATRVP